MADISIPQAEKGGKLWIFIVLAATLAASAAGFATGQILNDGETTEASAVEDLPVDIGLSAGFGAPAGIVAVRIEGPSGAQTIAADLRIGFSTSEAATRYSYHEGFRRLREAILMSMSDIAQSGLLDVTDEWISELALSLATELPSHIPEVVDVRVNEAVRSAVK